ncbi:MAG: RnfABCDGE type electron transport complex subunit G [Bacteroidaceae bacterium]|nr:RnfABCDGE type electron transport complex subunit G [Bacteroidaceae bacterium]
MKKLKSTLPNMALVLTSIALIAGLALGYVNSVTAGPIEQIKAKQLSDGIKAVLAADEVVVETPDTLESGAIIYQTDKGVAVQATDLNGFGGKLSVLVGFNAEGLIQGYQVLETSETPGLGAKAGEWFQKGQKGDIIGKQAGNLTVSKDGGEVDAITASTITSRAFLRCVNAAYAALSEREQEDAQTGATAQIN